MRPVIGLIPLYDDEKNSYWMLPGYMRALEKFGAVPIMFPYTTDEKELEIVYSLCNGVLFTGGHDVSPEVYGEKPTEKCGIGNKVRDCMEAYLMDRCISDDKPFLGICRGIQFMNAHLGGNLYQDLPSEYDCKADHHMEPPYDRGVHKVNVLEDTHLAKLIGAGWHDVNSYHHQAIKELSPKVESMAVSEDGLIEAIAVKNHRFAIGVQWHPEFSYENNEESAKIMRAFVEECK
ncbi:MAG: gamma-glutamyl-gamma-aminobutyrate hydrolase family protein [Lachnospiraceae bacterium]|nr:gamma-glutamyl-gamma-aminobutyrate hydrolase family protein [Lachnospiraceae bacterium]